MMAFLQEWSYYSEDPYEDPFVEKQINNEIIDLLIDKLKEARELN